MQEYLIVCGGIAMLTSIVFSWLWYSPTDTTRFAISGLYLCVALFSAIRLYERFHEISHSEGVHVGFQVPHIIVAPVWTLLAVFNVIMAIALIRTKMKRKDGPR